MKIQKILALAALGALSASALSAYTLNGRKWFATGDAVFFLNSASAPACCLSASQMSSQILSGLNAWGTLSYGGTTTRSGAKKDGVNSVSWAKLGGTTLGITNYVSTDTSQSQICNGNQLFRFDEVDVRFNNAYRFQTSSTCTDGIDLQGVATHEFGHAVGLGHSSVPAATMFASVVSCDFSKSSLENDDRAGYSALYSCH